MAQPEDHGPDRLVQYLEQRVLTLEEEKTAAQRRVMRLEMQVEALTAHNEQLDEQVTELMNITLGKVDAVIEEAREQTRAIAIKEYVYFLLLTPRVIEHGLACK